MDTKVVVGGGIALFLVVAVWQVVAAAAIPGSPLFVPVAIGLQLAVTFGALWTTRSRQRYLAQLGTGSAIGAVGAVGIGATSLLLTSVVFPDLAAATGASSGEAAMAGVMGTLFTGVFGSAVIAVGLRER